VGGEGKVRERKSWVKEKGCGKVRMERGREQEEGKVEVGIRNK